MLEDYSKYEKLVYKAIKVANITGGSDPDECKNVAGVANLAYTVEDLRQYGRYELVQALQRYDKYKTQREQKGLSIAKKSTFLFTHLKNLFINLSKKNGSVKRSFLKRSEFEGEKFEECVNYFLTKKKADAAAESIDEILEIKRNPVGLKAVFKENRKILLQKLTEVTSDELKDRMLKNLEENEQILKNLDTMFEPELYNSLNLKGGLMTNEEQVAPETPVEETVAQEAVEAQPEIEKDTFSPANASAEEQPVEAADTQAVKRGRSSAAVGTIRDWKIGRYIKTPTGWMKQTRYENRQKKAAAKQAQAEQETQTAEVSSEQPATEVQPV